MTTPEFRIESAEGTARFALLRLHGELDPRSAPVLLSHCRRFAAERRGLVLNLAGVTFLSSSGMGAILALIEEFRQHGQIVKLAEVSAPVESVIRLLNLDQLLILEPREANALEDGKAA